MWIVLMPLLSFSGLGNSPKQEQMETWNLLHILMLLGYVCTYLVFVSSAWTSKDYVAATISKTRLTSVKVVLSASVLLYFYIFSATNTSNTAQATPRRLLRMSFMVFILFGLLFLPANNSSNQRTYSKETHPIDLLVTEAEAQHNEWLSQASASKSLEKCVTEYRHRYHQHPPPGFDEWYEYAMKRNSVVIDDFDNIMDDLHPFWAVKPVDIRESTRQILSDPWNEVAEITIRSGKAEVGPDVKPTHRWMLDGVIAMLGNFVDKLPDMDLAFNINDEPRVAIPHSDLQDLWKNAGRKAISETALDRFSSNRSSHWHPAKPSNSNADFSSFRPFDDHSFLPSFQTFGSIACPPSSFARTTHTWDSRTLCTKCTEPHSNGLFLSNWTLAASPCHQPDLAHLHGFYLSPAAFKPSKRLLPVFSQSKARGYADILYPSPWNYRDKIKYDPTDADGAFPDAPFSQKENTLFWRGATSEGLSRWGTWKGMVRQRFVHMTNNMTAETPVPILLPSTENESQYTYQHLPYQLLQSIGLNTSTSFVSSIARCWDRDCSDQQSEFGLPGPTDFQTHWRHRYLMDLDGAGFSGRFLPFLQSRSLPFKAAIFREWWEGRVTAWKHFVPVD
ncbi:MAG: hypothetical protein Q9190_007453, partial [Brigantiaea leucoxantha]